MSNDNGKNFIMKIHIFLIVLVFIQLCFSIETNITIDDDHTDPITLLRGKRQLTEYTRWRSNLVTVTKREFIVQVDDDAYNGMPTTASSTPIVAINIQPATKAVEKIIVGGAMVPLQTTVPIDLETPLEYTRFVPPAPEKPIDIDNIIYPQINPKPGPAFPLAKHSNRDESPPASPQFISRAPGFARQYAPITAVAFYPRLTASPVTPSTVPEISPIFSPSRSSIPLNVELTRTNLEPQNFNSLPLTRTDEPDLKSFFVTLVMDDTKETISPDALTGLQMWNADREEIPTRTTPLELDAYHMMFYNDEDNEVGNGKNKKEDQDIPREKIYTEVNEVSIDTKIRKNDALNFRVNPAENFTINATTELSISPEDSRTPKPRLGPALKCSLLKYRQLSFNSPRTLPEIVAQLKKWAERSPIATAIDITANNLTTMDNPIYMMVVDDPSSGQVVSAKDVVMIIAGIQGRDHHAVTAAMYVLYQLIERTEAHSDLLTKYRFWIIPVFNPDGYDYSMTFAQRREWTKNLHQSWEECTGHKACKDCEPFGLRCTLQPCHGVHLDRNFEYQWIPAEELRAEHPCGDLYAGARQLSERETRALTTFLHERQTPISMFIAFKEGDVLRKRASRAASAAYSISGRPYVAGQTSEFLPLYAGGVEDWVDGHLGIDNTYTVMMFRPSDSYNSKLITEHVVHEAYAALDTLLLETGNTLGIEAKHIFRPQKGGAARAFLHHMLISVAAILIFNS